MKEIQDLEFILSDSSSWCINSKERSCFEDCEPTSVLDTVRSPRPFTSSSTLSSSLGSRGAGEGGGAFLAGGSGGGGTASTDTAGVAAVSGNPSSKWQQDSNTATSSNMDGAESELLQRVPPSLKISGGSSTAAPEKCAMEDWESVLSESADALQEQEPLLRWITGDPDDPSMASLSKLLEGGDQAEYEFNGGLGFVDRSFGTDLVTSSGGGFLPSSSFPANAPVYKLAANPQTPIFPLLSNNLGSAAFNPALLDSSDMKPHIFNPQHQSQHLQKPSFFMQLTHAYQGQSLSMPPPAKRHNPGTLGVLEPGPHQVQLLLQQQEIIDHLFKVAELVQTGKLVLAQGILARLNHQLSPIGKSFNRAAFYFKEALQSLLQSANNNMNPSTPSSPFSLIFKIGAYKSFSEVSPMAQFANFTGNQALLEVLEGFDRIHIVDFDIGYGEQWASLMQELALKSSSTPSLKITALASHSKHEQLELGVIRDNLIHFASEVKMAFEFETLSVDHLNSSSQSLPPHLLDSEGAIAVNLAVGCFSRYQVSLPLVLRFVKQLSPKIVISIDKGCDRTDLPFPDQMIHALRSYSNLLESLDAVNVNLDSLQKIERFLLQPGVEKIVMARFDSPEKTQHWRTVLLSSGFSPFTFSNFTESQAECLVKRTPIGGFHVEKRHSSLVLCWQQKELISASAWRC